ncbi:MAG TPA: S8 family serine peptidase, partial [Dehalococcoidia bacterium]
GHGTYVAGEIVAAWNSSGVAGLAPGVRLMVVRALDCNGTGFTSDLANGIAYAAAGGARVVNLSLGGHQPDPALESTINAAVAAGVVVVAAAGNCGDVTSPVPGCPAQNAPMYPAAYPAVIAVSASDGPSNPDGRASFSNWGDYVDLAAPGVGVCSTTRGGGYACNLVGTSMATPLVSGVAALLLSAKPGLSPAQVADHLKAFAVNLPDGSTPNWDGAGRVNAIAVALPYRAAAPGVAR